MKKWYESKMLWVNAIALIAAIAQVIAGKEVISAEMQVIILSAVNALLRLITKREINWKRGNE